MKQKFLRVHEVAEQLKVSPSTVRDYERAGKIDCSRTPSGQRVFTQEQVNNFLGIEVLSNQKMVYYARSSRGSNSELESQVNALTELYGEPYKIYKDKGSGLNEKRKALNKLLDDIIIGEVTSVCITQKDRLTRFGFNYLERFMKLNNVNIIVLSEKETTLQEELLQDFMSLIASFSGKFYRLRGYEQQQQLINKLQDTLNEEQDKTD